jgi:hypothetical protein
MIFSSFYNRCGYKKFEYLITNFFSIHYSQEQKKKLALKALKTLHFLLVQGKLYRQGQDQVQ